jgi:hypothetical protein
LVLTLFAMPKVNPRNTVGGERPRSRSERAGAMEGLGGGASALLPRRILGLALYVLTVLIRMLYVWTLRRPGQSMALAAALAVALLALRSAPRDGIIISSGSFPPPLPWTHNLPRATNGLTGAILQRCLRSSLRLAVAIISHCRVCQQQDQSHHRAPCPPPHGAFRHRKDKEEEEEGRCSGCACGRIR